MASKKLSKNIKVPGKKIPVPGIKPGSLSVPKMNLHRYPPLPFMGATMALNAARKKNIPLYNDNKIGKFFDASAPTIDTGLASLSANVQSTGIRQAAANMVKSSKVIKRFGSGKTIGVGLGATVALATASAVSRGRMRRREREEMQQM